MWRGAILAVVLWSCGGGSANPSLENAARPSAARVATATAAPPLAAGPLVVFLGDSLTAGYGLAEEEAFPTLIAEHLAQRGTPIRLVNAGVSGDTSAGGLRRLDWVMSQRPEVLVVELGANDGLRGQPLESIEENLRQIVQQARTTGCRVLLVGMRVPPSLGEAYSEGFAAIFPRLAEELDVPLMPFLLAGVGADLDLNLPDGIHPTAAGHRRVAESLLPYLEPLLGPASG